jgi:sec-independent protein translocase protein TatA
MPFGLGFGETILIFLMLVLLFGPGKLPELGGSIGKGIRDFRDALNGVGEDAPSSGLPALPPPEGVVPTAAPAAAAEPVAAEETVGSPETPVA